MEYGYGNKMGCTYKKHMELKENQGVTYLSYPDFETLPGFYHGFSTRLGGVSQGIYASMNLSFQRGDKEAHVRENYRRIARALDFLWKKQYVPSRPTPPIFGWLQGRMEEKGLSDLWITRMWMA